MKTIRSNEISNTFDTYKTKQRRCHLFCYRSGILLIILPLKLVAWVSLVGYFTLYSFSVLGCNRLCLRSKLQNVDAFSWCCLVPMIWNEAHVVHVSLWSCFMLPGYVIVFHCFITWVVCSRDADVAKLQKHETCIDYDPVSVNVSVIFLMRQARHSTTWQKHSIP